MKYFNEYDTQEEYLTDIDNLGLPNVILIGDDEVVYEGYLKFEDPEVWRICCTNWGDYIEVVVTDNGDNTVNITRTPVMMKYTTAKRGRPETEYNVDNTPDASGNTPYEVGTTKEPVGISKRQCEAVKSLQGKFRSNTIIQRFNEYKYFSGITTVNGQGEFNACTNLHTLELPPNRTSILSYEFARAYINNLVLPSGITVIKSMAFWDTQTSPKNGRFVFNEGFTTIEAGAFHGMYTQIIAEFPSTLTTVGGKTCFCTYNRGTLKVIIHRSEPPTVQAAFEQLTNTKVFFYVPDEAVDTYKEATYWSQYANKIYPISSFNG